ncbi:chymotrypsin-like protease CTRL-1 isoform X1 [Drosophila gunungcola]|uniref:Peptidase S1 domain-containing protein n=1 Tax=Drosophila gunungcola TaxID=103775 RepID=A0A9P9YZJ6_9MUSC|nr:chymotrypsin-like protease CTRL-1 isoform X1 [Drosophila gunungcola]KAI8046016.1 hypothetical protein M5D96_002216 [Drosophila gunungcola]
MTYIVFGVLFSCLLLHQGSAKLLDLNCAKISNNSVSKSPWMALVQLPDKNCSGSLIHKQFVIASTNCVFNQSELTVILGKFNGKLHKKHFDMYPTMKISVQNVFIHNKFDRDNYKNDLALLQLEQPVPYKENIRPICIWLNRNEIQNEKKVIKTTLWDVTKKMVLPIPQTRNLALFSPIECKHVLDVAPNESHICAGYKCNASCVEAGSPLIQKINIWNTSVNTLIGIQSYGVSGTCLYSRISSYIDWIVGIVMEIDVIVSN